MSREVIKPSTLDGIKRLAKSFKNEQGIQHNRALDAAAKSAGFQNFKHARNLLGSGSESQISSSRYRIFLTAYWIDKKLGTEGRETLPLLFDNKWSDLVTTTQLKSTNNLALFRMEGPDHLAQNYPASSQSQARRNICAAARTLQFIDATKLRPSRSHSRAFPGGRSTNAVPGRDHYSIWYDPDTKRYLFADEPYENAAKNVAAERAAWSQLHGFSIAQPSWPGMYNPDGGSRLYLISDLQNGIPLDPIVAALDRLPEIVEATWNGESAPFTPIFFSPGTLAHANARTTEKQQEKLRRTTKGPRKTVGYVRTFVGPQRRPKGKMPIEVHIMVGNLLKSVLVDTYHRKGVFNRVNGIRSELDEWVQREYNDQELPNEQFFDLYYHETDAKFSRSLTVGERLRHVGNLNKVKEVLVQHYPDSPPLRGLLKKLESAINSIQTWGGDIPQLMLK